LEPSGPSARLLPEGFGGAASPFRVSSAGMNVTSGIFAWIDSCIRGKCGSAAGACVRETEKCQTEKVIMKTP
jgi:hypothetical protein